MGFRLCIGLVLAPLALIRASGEPASRPLSPTLELDVQDAKRNRTIPILVYFPPADAPRPAPVVLFSHGLGGSRHGYVYLGQHWSSRGYVCVFLQHPGSDDRVWKDSERTAILGSLRNAASLQNYLLRAQDVPAVLDQLEIWGKQKGHALEGRLNLEQVGMAGHSFGAITTQCAMGQESPMGGARFRESRIDAAIVLSPSPPQVGSPERAFGNVRIPVLAMTGTLDNDPVRSSIQPQDRRKVYAALPPGNKYELVFDGGRHSAFSDRSLGLDPPRHERIHPAIQAITTAFWDAYLKGNEDAKKWLRSDAARKLLATSDIWEWQ